jgi:hypothetical protein
VVEEPERASASASESRGRRRGRFLPVRSQELNWPKQASGDAFYRPLPRRHFSSPYSIPNPTPCSCSEFTCHIKHGALMLDSTKYNTARWKLHRNGYNLPKLCLKRAWPVSPCLLAAASLRVSVAESIHLKYYYHCWAGKKIGLVTWIGFIIGVKSRLTADCFLGWLATLSFCLWPPIEFWLVAGFIWVSSTLHAQPRSTSQCRPSLLTMSAPECRPTKNVGQLINVGPRKM